MGLCVGPWGLNLHRVRAQSIPGSGLEENRFVEGQELSLWIVRSRISIQSITRIRTWSKAGPTSQLCVCLGSELSMTWGLCLGPVRVALRD